tara:strand:+ start:563 stop:2566 length:2004 start_codon:yes stop_codon:yes gene_type:complete
MANELRVNLIGDASKLNKSLNTASAKLQAFGKSARKIGSDLSLKLTAPLVLAGGAAIKMASDFEETESKFNTVFSSIQDQAQQTAKTFKESFGLSELAAKDMLSSTGDLLVGFGFAETEALNLSNQVNQLAVDLASFTNFSGGAKGASEALTKALLGERESIKSLGIAITETDLKEFAAQQGLVFKELDRVAKATLTYELALKQSSKAVGDAERTQHSFANQFRRLQGDLQDLAVEFGEILLPAATDLIEKLRGLIKRFEGLDDETKKNIVTIGLIVGAIGPVLIAIGALSTGLGVVTGAFTTLTTVMMANPFIAIGAAVITLTGLLIEQSKKIAPLVDGFTTIKNLFKSLGNPVEFVTLQLRSQADEQKNLEETTEDVNEATDKNTQSQKEEEKAIVQTTKAIKKQQVARASLFGVSKKQTEIRDTETGFSVQDVFVNENLAGIAPTAMDPASALAVGTAEGNKKLQSELLNTANILKQDLEQRKAPLLQFQELGLQLSDNMSSTFQSMGSSIAQSLGMGETALGTFAGTLIQTAMTQLGASLAATMATGAQSAGQTALSFGPLAAIVLPALLAGAAVAVKGAFSKIKAPAKFASGGIVSAPTMGLVGEYPGSRSNPEVIAPLDRLKGMLGDRGVQQVNVGGSFTLKGQDLVVALERANSNRNRIL